MKDLFFFTNAYPCNISLEAYIDNEIEFLSRQFHKVYIFPVDFGEVKKKVPENIEVVDLNKFQKISVFGLLINLPVIFSILIPCFFKATDKLYYLKNIIASVLRINNAIEYGKALMKFAESKGLPPNSICYYTYWFYNSALGLSILKSRGWIPDFFSRAHQGDMYESETKDNSKIFFQYYMLSKVKKLFVISEHAKRYIIAKYPKLKDRIKVSYLGTKDLGMAPFEVSKEFVVASCSKFSDNKRVFLIPEILKNLTFPIRWIHFGYSDEEDVIKVKRAIENLPPNIRVELKGFQKNEDILDFYSKNNINLFLNISIKEGLSVAIMEAMSFGIPALASDVNATNEIVNSKTGFLIPIHFDVNEVSKIIERFYHSDQSEKRKNSREHFLRNFKDTENYSGFIKELILSNGT